MGQNDTVQAEIEFSFNISQHALTAVSGEDDMGRRWAGTLKDVIGNVFFCSRGSVIYRLLCWCWFRDDDDEDDDRRQWLDLRTKSFKSLTGSFIEKKNYLYLLNEGVVCFLGMRVYFVLYEPCLWCYLFINCFIIYFIYVSLDLCNSFFRAGCIPRWGCGWDQDKMRRCQTNVPKQNQT